MGKFRDNLRKLAAEQLAFELLPSNVSAKLVKLADVKSVRPLHSEDKQTNCTTHTALLKGREYITAQVVVNNHVGVVKFSRPVVLVSEYHVSCDVKSGAIPEPYRAVSTR